MANKLPRWKTLSIKELASNKFLTLNEVEREEEGTGKRGDFFILEAPDWANIIAITEDNSVVMVEQFRQGSARIELEIPGGIVDKDEDPSKAILRELKEETGYGPSAASKFELIGTLTPNPAIINNSCNTYLLTHAVPIGSTEFDEHENISQQLIPLSSIPNLIRAGEIRHALMIAAFHWLHLHLENNDRLQPK